MKLLLPLCALAALLLAGLTGCYHESTRISGTGNNLPSNPAYRAYFTTLTQTDAGSTWTKIPDPAATSVGSRIDFEVEPTTNRGGVIFDRVIITMPNGVMISGGGGKDGYSLGTVGVWRFTAMVDGDLLPVWKEITVK